MEEDREKNMKKTNTGSKKLTLNVQTIRMLTSQDLTLVVGGACRKGTNPSVIIPNPKNGGGKAVNAGPPTC